MSLARNHRQRTVSEKTQQQAAEGGTLENSSEHELLQAQLTTHLRQLKNIKGQEKKTALKAELLPQYQPYIDGVLTADIGLQDNLFTTLLVWMIDIGESQQALEMAEYALKHQLAMPQRFNRSTPEVIVEEFSEYLLLHDDPECQTILQTLTQLTCDDDMHDAIRAKPHKILGLTLAETDPQNAITHLSRALELNPKCGVKQLRDKLEKSQQNQIAPTLPEANSETSATVTPVA